MKKLKKKIKEWWRVYDMTWADVVIFLICIGVLYGIFRVNDSMFIGILVGFYFGYQFRKVMQKRKEDYQVKKLTE